MKIKPILERIGTIGTGHTISFLLNQGFDYGVYVPVILFAGPVWGCGIMTILSVILNLTLVKVYDKTGKDWLGFELVKEGRENLTQGLPSWLRKLLVLGDFSAFIGLSIYDPFFAVIYLRKREQAFKGLSSRDWKIFVLSTLLANVGWTGLIYGGLSVLQWFLKAAHLS